ncbi:hypothetical protein OAN307_c26410 [Octadecabacter antarcticus 307]|uniref:Uncharacterized protein n=1 Tax=Octadecabacter antarcticus 307 TaxID=391626 RepID=M9REJ1_9RHOB|nr:hypothetical protein [Octadecabacter antarcticus]AGI68230.1 hypothetical protein OAN307_c26410 [Octadecabacter antarcticus 307]
MYILERQLPGKFQSLPSPFGKAALPAASDGAPAEPRLYSPRWRWSAALSAPPPVLGEAPQCHPLDILGVLDPVPAAASIHCALPEVTLSATERATQAFGAPPFAILLAILAVYETRLPAALQASSDDPPPRIGLFGPGAAAVRRAAIAINPKAGRHLIDLYAVRGIPDDPNEDPLPRGIWPVLCSAYLPARPASALPPMPLPTVLAHSAHEIPQRRAFAAERAKCSHRRVLMSICADDAEALHLPPDVRSRVTALPGLMDCLYAALSVLAAPDGALGPIRRFERSMGANLADEMAESAFELAMIARAHLIAFYARVRPAHTGPVHRAAAAMLRHRPQFISPTTLTSGVIGQDLRILEAAGWLEARDMETAHGLAHRFMPSDAFVRLDIRELPKKRASWPYPVSVVCDRE